MVQNVSLNAEVSLTLCYGVTIPVNIRLNFPLLLCYHNIRFGPNIMLLSYY